MTAALNHGRERWLAPLVVAVLDARAALKAFDADDDVPLGWSDIAVEGHRLADDAGELAPIG